MFLLTVDVAAAAAAAAAVCLTCAGTDALVEGADPMMTATPKGNVNMTYGSSCPVNEFPPSATGFYDVHGNVWEWVSGAVLSWRILRLPLDGVFGSPSTLARTSPLISWHRRQLLTGLLLCTYRCCG